MSLSSILIHQILVVFIIIFIGVICYKTNLIDNETNSKLSDILLYLVTPVVIFVSYQRDFSKDMMEGLLISLLLATALHVIGILVSYVVIRRKRRQNTVIDGVRTKSYVDNENLEVERIACAYGNVGFMGIPLVNGIYGSEGVFYVTAYMTLFNIFIWTHGVMVMTGSKGLNKKFLKKLISPTIISIILGLICFIFQIKVPAVMYEALNYVADFNTPLAMLVAGVTIGQSNIIKILTKSIRTYYVVFIKLLVVPLIVMALVIKLPINEMLRIIAIIMAGSPCATTIILFSIKYKKNSVLAAEIFTLAMLLCLVTIPLIVRIAEMLI